jgi:sugar/nucleoside kinase (ribokinase family)
MIMNSTKDHHMLKGLFTGLCTIDIQLYVKKYPESNSKNRVLSTRTDVGGPATNAAITFALLGGKARLLTMIGRHEFRDFMMDKLIGMGIEVIDLIEDLDYPPVISTVISSLENGDRTVMTSNLSTENHKVIKEIKGDFDIFLSDGYLTRMTEKEGSEARKKGKAFVLDGGSWKQGMERYLKYVDYAVCSSDFHPPGCKGMKEIISFLKGFNIKNIAITQGNKPVIAVTDNQETEIPVKKINALDTLGAGDVFHGAFCYYLPFERNFASALKQASMIASESCRYYGTRDWMKR